MALVLKDRVRETSISTGTGTIDVLGAVTGYQTFGSAIGSGNTCYYTIYNQGTNEWEVGLGTVGSGTLARDTVLSSSNAGSLVSFSAGTKDVFVTYPAEKAVYEDAAGNITPSALVVTSLTNSGLSSGRVTYASTGGLLVDSTNLTFNGTTLTSGGYSTSGNLTFTGTGNRITGNFGSGTVDTRILIQSSSSNTQTNIVAVENGTVSNGTGVAQLVVAESGYATNGNATTGSLLIVKNTDVRIASGILNSGTYLPMTFHTGGSERMRIDTSGNVGIGTSSPTQRLDVNGVVKLALTSAPTWDTNSYLWSESGVGLNLDGFNVKINTGNTRNERMRIDSAGNVGIGTSSPQFKLEVGANTGQNIVRINGGASNTADGGALYIRTGANTDIAYGNLSSIVGGAYNGLNTIFSSLGTIFMTGGSNERMRIDSAGNVGIGTSSPNDRLEVNGNIRAPVLRTGGTAATLELYAGTSFNTGGSAIALRGSTTGFNPNGIEIYAGGSERMRIDSSGNVGIGTSSPTQKLQVDGNARLGLGAFLAFPDSGGSVTRFANGEFIATSGQQLQLCADNADGTIAFFTTSTGTSSRERMRIDSSGNVGIGTSSPGTRLAVAGGRTALFPNNEAFALQLNNGTANNGPFLGSSGLDTFVVSTSGGAERMRIDANGNVTITQAPGRYTIDTAGSAISIANNGTVDFPTASGMLVVNSHTSGAVSIYLCGSGNTANIGNVLAQVGTLALNVGINGYTWTNNSGITATFGFFFVRTRAGA